ncbi:MAG: hypothetical protein SCALA702_26250 [Melioribacteraceae bacterium]|nr:MAG: hypothetical protein SCALA702_26250 [Melioribacteraceae bacterium]
MNLLTSLLFMHPGHHHDGNFWNQLIHFASTYYVFIIAGLLGLFLVKKFLFKKQAD